MAEERGLDLVEVAPNADPPVCRLMDYGKYRYDQAKKEREARKNQKVVELKELRFKSPNIDQHDIEVRTDQARRFLGEGDKVKFTVRLRGRQLAHPEVGLRMLEDVAETLRDAGVVEQRPMFEGRQQTMILAPAPAKSSKRSDRAAPTSAPAQPAEQPQTVEG
jgi:translation initiation factor IF-3